MLRKDSLTPLESSKECLRLKWKSFLMLAGFAHGGDAAFSQRT
jgi:hypothetical protein